MESTTFSVLDARNTCDIDELDDAVGSTSIGRTGSLQVKAYLCYNSVFLTFDSKPSSSYVSPPSAEDLVSEEPTKQAELVTKESHKYDPLRVFTS